MTVMGIRASTWVGFALAWVGFLGAAGGGIGGMLMLGLVVFWWRRAMHDRRHRS